MTELRSDIIRELQKLEPVLKSSGFNGDEAGIVLLYFLKLVSSGKIRGVFTVRLNGHHIGDPKLQDMKESLNDLRQKYVDKETMV